MKRGSLTDGSGINQTNQISVNNGQTWLSYGDTFTIGGNTFTYDAAQSTTEPFGQKVSSTILIEKMSENKSIFGSNLTMIIGIVGIGALVYMYYKYKDENKNE